MKEFIPIDECEGKTISKMGWHSNRIVVSFTDNTFSIIDKHIYFSNRHEYDVESHADRLDLIGDNCAAISLGIATVDEVKRALAEEEAARRQRVEQEDRREYKRLKDKFEAVSK